MGTAFPARSPAPRWGGETLLCANVSEEANVSAECTWAAHHFQVGLTLLWVQGKKLQHKDANLEFGG